MSQTTPHSSPAPAGLHAAPAPAATRLWGLIPCAGNGSRSGAAGPKQYQIVAGQPMVWHTLAAFAAVSRLADTFVVVSPGDGFFEPLAEALQAPKPLAQNAHGRPFAPVVQACGGATRAQSVLNGLDALRQQGAGADDWALVHDAARCLITAEQINTLIDACLSDAVGGLLALPLPDTLKAAQGGRVSATLERSDKWLAQTPQMFRIAALQAALRSAGDAVTDESSAMEAAGLRPLLVQGSAQNFKVTYPQDFALAQSLLLARKSAA
jgi:2-C-methyl-D-erythritol 4-phosphate cytidylyltransferase